MDSAKVGQLILKLRKEKNMTQREVAEAMHISDKTISKWERGLGCPDISLLPGLSRIFGVNIEKILVGDLAPNDMDGGNMKRIKFYVCPDCGNVLTATGNAEISCCGRRLTALTAAPAQGEHEVKVEAMEDEYYLTFTHEMRKEHYLSFAAAVTYDRVLLVKLYPEQNAELRIPQLRRSKLYYYCTQHGLMVTELN